MSKNSVEKAQQIAAEITPETNRLDVYGRRVADLTSDVASELINLLGNDGALDRIAAGEDADTVIGEEQAMDHSVRSSADAQKWFEGPNEYQPYRK